MSGTSSDGLIRGVVFDMDGTLTEHALDFAGMREAIDVAPGEDILGALAVRAPAARAEAEAIIARFEAEAAAAMVLRPGARALMDALDAMSIPRALITRNNRASVDVLNARGISFPIELDRSFQPPKPDPASLLHIIAQWGMQPGEVLMVGDSRHDLVTARRAGAQACLIRAGRGRGRAWRLTADYVIDALVEIEGIVRYSGGR